MALCAHADAGHRMNAKTTVQRKRTNAARTISSSRLRSALIQGARCQQAIKALVSKAARVRSVKSVKGARCQSHQGAGYQAPAGAARQPRFTVNGARRDVRPEHVVRAAATHVAGEASRHVAAGSAEHAGG